MPLLDTSLVLLQIQIFTLYFLRSLSDYHQIGPFTTMCDVWHVLSWWLNIEGAKSKCVLSVQTNLIVSFNPSWSKISVWKMKCVHPSPQIDCSRPKWKNLSYFFQLKTISFFWFFFMKKNLKVFFHEKNQKKLIVFSWKKN